MRTQVEAATTIRQQRFGRDTGPMPSARIRSRDLRKQVVLDPDGERLLRQAVSELGLSARSQNKVLRVARTIADLAGEERVMAGHLSEAIQHRRWDRSL
jgi:magnesium chelatase family protein